MDLPKEAKRAPSAPVWNQSFPSPNVLISRPLCWGQHGPMNSVINCSRLVTLQWE